MKHTRLFAIFLCLCLLLTACGSPGSADYGNSYDQSVSTGEASPQYTPMGEPSSQKQDSLTSNTSGLSNVTQTDRKLIKTVTIEAETENYDDLASALDEKIIALGGYVENRRIGSHSRERRWSSMTIRIPANNLSAFVSHVSSNANVLSTAETTTDVTLQYADTEMKITSLETEQTRLLELLESAKSLDEVLKIEDRLGDVTYELERYASQKRSYDNQVTYATVSLTIEEVRVLTPVKEPTVWERIATGFMSSINEVAMGITELIIWIIVNSPHLVVQIVFLTLFIALYRRFREKSKKRRCEPDFSHEQNTAADGETETP